MTEHVLLDASAVARVLRRASDLERATGADDDPGSISEASLIAAAEEVGLSIDALRRSIAVERLGPPPPARRGDRVLGPAQVYVEGEVGAPAGDALAEVDSWLVDGHHLRRDVLRPGHGEWSRRSDLVGVTVRAVRHATGEGRLGDCDRINASARETGDGSSVVRITIDRSPNRRRAGGGGAVIAVGGTAGAIVAGVALTPFVLLAMPVAIVAGIGVASSGKKRARETEREARRLLDAVSAGAGPTRLRVDIVRRATGRATSLGSNALRTRSGSSLLPAHVRNGAGDRHSS
jgi:hypothetical protein